MATTVNLTLLKAAIAFVPVSVLFGYSVATFVKRRTLASALLAVGAVCLLLVVFTHIAEALHLFPALRFGEPDSVGHYVNLTSAWLGVVLIVIGYVLQRRERRLAQVRTPVNRAGGHTIAS